MIDKPVFFDASGRRASRMSVFGRAAAIVTTFIGIVFIILLITGWMGWGMVYHQRVGVSN